MSYGGVLSIGCPYADTFVVAAVFATTSGPMARRVYLGCQRAILRFVLHD